MSQNLTNVTISPDVQITPAFDQLFNFADKPEVLQLEDWIAILTLCFSPLIAHIFAGVPTVVRRTPTSPTWLDYLCLYNPTTILWRYLAIADRRMRYHRRWSAADMAASNAVFWTADGFDGSEAMMRASRAFCSRVPAHNHTAIFSSDSLKMLITTAQGLQAITVLIRGILAINGVGNKAFSATLALDSVFYPLAVVGLLRLFAAPWLTEAYCYREHDSYEPRLPPPAFSHTSLAYPPPPSADDTDATSTTTMTKPRGGRGSLTLLEPSPDDAPSPTGHFRALLVRLLYLLLLCFVLGICICYLVPFHGASASYVQQRTSAATLFLVGAVYVFFSAVSLVVLGVFLARSGSQTTTVLPCLRAWWYRLYTLVLLAGMVAMIVLTGVFTRRTACGRLTVFPPLYDQQACQGTPMGSLFGQGPFAIVNQTPELSPQTWMLPLQGWCSGTLTGDVFPIVQVVSD